MLVVIRVDASNDIGSGHVMRCLTLAEALRNKGASVEFISRLHDGHMCELIKQRGFNVSRLTEPNIEINKGKLKHSSWLGADWKYDAEQTRSIIESLNKKPDWLVIDHYAIDEKWEKSLRSIVKKIFVIDDIADRQHDCELLLDQNLIEDMQTRYNGKVPARCTLLLGSEYTLLQPIYAELHERIAHRNGPIGNIFIFFGRSDINNITELVLQAVLNLNRADIEINIVISQRSPYFDALELIVSEYMNVKIHSELPSLASLMAKADLAIGASGCTSWERLCLGLPSLVITMAENQRPIAAELQALGLVECLGNLEQITKEKISEKLKQIIDSGISEDWSKKCWDTVDGKGTERVYNSMGLSFEN